MLAEDNDPLLDGDEDFANVYNVRIIGRDKYFWNILLSVTEEENKVVLTEEDEERLFSKICWYLKKPFAPIGLCTLQKLAFLPSTVSNKRLQEIAKVICQNVFNPVSAVDDGILEYVDFCKGFAYLKGTTNEGTLVTFEQVLIYAFLDELPKKFNYSQRLKLLLDNRNIAEDKKQRWLKRQTEDQERVFKAITKRSVLFLAGLYQLYPEIVYRVILFLVKSPEEEANLYLQALLLKTKNERFHLRDNDKEHKLTNIYVMKKEFYDRRHHLFNQRQIAAPLPVEQKSLTHLVNEINALWGHFPEMIFSEDALREITPQDYIKYSIKDVLEYEKLKPIDDFKVEDVGESYDINTYILRSKNFFGSDFQHLWKGLRVKVLTNKTSKPSVRGQNSKAQRGKQRTFI